MSQFSAIFHALQKKSWTFVKCSCKEEDANERAFTWLIRKCAVVDLILNFVQMLEPRIVTESDEDIENELDF